MTVSGDAEDAVAVTGAVFEPVMVSGSVFEPVTVTGAGAESVTWAGDVDEPVSRAGAVDEPVAWAGTVDEPVARAELVVETSSACGVGFFVVGMYSPLLNLLIYSSRLSVKFFGTSCGIYTDSRIPPSLLLTLIPFV